MRHTSCDGPDCSTTAPDPTGDDDDLTEYGWVHVTAWHDKDCGDFCSYECLAAHALTRALGDD